MKKFLIWSFVVIASLILFSHIFCFVLCNVNYKKNMKVWEELNYTGIIYDQSEWDDFKYGLGTVAKNGCGAIAVYNILVLENKYKPFPEIIKYFDNDNENIFGLLGTNPFAVKSYLKKQGYKTKIYFKEKNFKDAAINSKYAILMYVNWEYGHFQLLYDYDGQYFKENPKYKIDFDKLMESKKNFFKLLITVN